MQTNTTLLVTGIIFVVVGAIMAIGLETAYAATAIEYTGPPGQIVKITGGEISAKSVAPGQQAAQTGLPASQFAPGIEKKAIGP